MDSNACGAGIKQITDGLTSHRSASQKKNQQNGKPPLIIFCIFVLKVCRMLVKGPLMNSNYQSTLDEFSIALQQSSLNQ